MTRLNRTLGLETLESREVPAISLVNGQLQVIGGDLDDRVAVLAKVGPGDDVVTQIEARRTVMNGTWFVSYETKTFDWAAVESIYVDLGDGKNTFTSDAVKNTVVIGGSGADKMTGAGGMDIFYGNGGDDTLTGNGGTDYLFGGEGNDNLDGGDGNDFARGGDGFDVISGGNGDDVLRGEGGIDVIYGNNGNDTLEGGAGDDWLEGGYGLDTLDGGPGYDVLYQDFQYYPLHPVDQHDQ